MNLKLELFDMKYAHDYYVGFNEEITKYQWPDPFETEEDAMGLLQNFVDEAAQGEMLFYAVLSETGDFLGSVEVHGLREDCPELGVWIKESEWGKGYAYAALREALDIACEKHGKRAFFYEADVRNVGSMKLLHKFEDAFGIESREPEKLVTDSGKRLELQGFIMKRK